MGEALAKGPLQATELQSPRCLGSVARSSPLLAPVLTEDDVDKLRMKGCCQSSSDAGAKGAWQFWLAREAHLREEELPMATRCK